MFRRLVIARLFSSFFGNLANLAVGAEQIKITDNTWGICFVSNMWSPGSFSRRMPTSPALSISESCSDFSPLTTFSTSHVAAGSTRKTWKLPLSSVLYSSVLFVLLLFNIESLARYSRMLLRSHITVYQLTYKSQWHSVDCGLRSCQLESEQEMD